MLQSALVNVVLVEEVEECGFATNTYRTSDGEQIVEELKDLRFTTGETSVSRRESTGPHRKRKEKSLLERGRRLFFRDKGR